MDEELKQLDLQKEMLTDILEELIDFNNNH